jgi:hypothetical protein
MGKEEIKEDWADAPLYQPLMGLYMNNLQAKSEDYGTPGAPGAPGGPPGADGGDDDGNDGAPPFGGGQPAPDAPGGNDDNGTDMQKSFGLPVFAVEP